MADRKITDHSALTGANTATGDLFEVVDVSDTTDHATGTNKKMTATEKAAAMLLHGASMPLWTFRPGYYYSTIDGNGTIAVASGDLFMVPFPVYRTQTFDRIGVDVTTLGASAKMRLGISNDNGGGLPGTVVLDAGTIDASTTGNKPITISQSLTPGLYWLMGLGEDATATYRSGASSRMPMPMATTISSASIGGWLKSSTTIGSIPASPGGSGTVQVASPANTPKISLRPA